MQLKSLYVENYRAVKKAFISFDSTTVFIGENESGKSSLLNVLRKVLDPDMHKSTLQFESYQFHRGHDTGAIDGPILIRVCFSEQHPEEWSGKLYEPIEELLTDSRCEIRQLILEINVPPIQEKIVEGTWKIYEDGGDRIGTDPDILDWCQKMNPVIHLKAGMLTGRGVDNIPNVRSTARNLVGSQDIKSIVQRIENSAEQLLSGKSTNNLEVIEEGFKAARQFIALYRKIGGPKIPRLARKVSDILGKETVSNERSLSPLLSGQTNTAKRLGVFLLIAALIRSTPEDLDSVMDPIWIIEDPEAHLHPMTLASVNMLLDSIGWQKILTTYSGELLSKVPLNQVRRLRRIKGVVNEYRINDKSLDSDDLRKISYHLRAYNSEAFFSRLWLFVEGESEFWIIPQLAHFMGYEFPLEGISCIVFAQAGLEPLIKVARELGIEWHMLADGDTAGQAYKETALHFVTNEEEEKRITLLAEKDIEHCFWKNGYSGFYLKQAQYSNVKKHENKAGKVIKRAIKHHSKPHLSLSIAEAVIAPGSPGIPERLENLIKKCVELARDPSGKSS